MQGRARFFAAREIVSEVLEKIEAGIGWKRGVSANQVRSAWDRVLAPLVTVVDVPGLFQDAVRVRKVALMDLDDVPTARLALLLAPVCVVSCDKHLRSFASGTGHADELSAATLSMSTFDTNASALGLLGEIGIETIVGIAKLALKKPVPAAALFAVTAVAGYLGWQSGRGPKAIDVLGEATRTVMPRIVHSAGIASAARQAAAATYARLVLLPEQPTSTLNVLANVLATSTGPLSATELSKLVGDLAGDCLPITARGVNDLLERCLAFVKQRRRWQLGHRVANARLQSTF